VLEGVTVPNRWRPVEANHADLRVRDVVSGTQTQPLGQGQHLWSRGTRSGDCACPPVADSTAASAAPASLAECLLRIVRAPDPSLVTGLLRDRFPKVSLSELAVADADEVRRELSVSSCS
jgi:hypothetical protein